MNIGTNNQPHDTPGWHCGWFYEINNSKDWEILVKRLDGLGINFGHVMQMILGMDKINVEQIGPMIHQGEHFDVG